MKQWLVLCAIFLVLGCARAARDDTASNAQSMVKEWAYLYHEGAPAIIGPGEVDNVVRHMGPYAWKGVDADRNGLVLTSHPAVVRFHLHIDRAGTIALRFHPHDGVTLWADGERVPDENLLATFGELVLNLDEGAHTVTFHVAKAGHLQASLEQGGTLTASGRVIAPRP